jgi:metal-dependent hydrolase (beta-lactamase superfamily II)
LVISAPGRLRYGLQGANFELIEKTPEIAPGITLIAPVSEAPGTKKLKELSLAVNTPDGLVLVVGCSHPGIDKSSRRRRPSIPEST